MRPGTYMNFLFKLHLFQLLHYISQKKVYNTLSTKMFHIICFAQLLKVPKALFYTGTPLFLGRMPKNTVIRLKQICISK